MFLLGFGLLMILLAGGIVLLSVSIEEMFQQNRYRPAEDKAKDPDVE